MMIKVCPICEAKFIDNQLYWATNKKGDPKDLAGLVCNKFRNGREGCINPLVGCEGGDTWEKRAGDIDSLMAEIRQD